MSKYLASYQNSKEDCWDLEISASTYKDALKEARAHANEYGKLWALRRIEHTLNKKYEAGKARAREEAIAYQESYYCPEMELSYGEIAEIQCRFEKLGKRFGLLREFRENGII